MSRKRRGTRPRTPKPTPAKKTPVTIGQWLNSAPHAKVTRHELMRWAEGMTLMTKPEVIEMFREYEHLRRWRRTKLFFDVTRSPIYQLIKRSMFEPKKTMADLSEEHREAVREELAKLDAEASQPREEPSAG